MHVLSSPGYFEDRYIIEEAATSDLCGNTKCPNAQAPGIPIGALRWASVREFPEDSRETVCNWKCLRPGCVHKNSVSHMLDQYGRNNWQTKIGGLQDLPPDRRAAAVQVIEGIDEKGSKFKVDLELCPLLDGGNSGNAPQEEEAPKKKRKAPAKAKKEEVADGGESAKPAKKKRAGKGKGKAKAEVVEDESIVDEA